MMNRWSVLWIREEFSLVYAIVFGESFCAGSSLCLSVHQCGAHIFVQVGLLLILEEMEASTNIFLQIYWRDLALAFLEDCIHQPLLGRL